MKTTQVFLECLDCETLWVLSGLTNRGAKILLTPGVKKTLSHKGDRCPLCQGLLLETDIKSLYEKFRLERDEARHLKVQVADWKDISTGLRETLSRREHDIQDLHKAPCSPPVTKCTLCGAPMKAGTSPRPKRFCSDKCRKRASRIL